jgi:transposase InsO family protein
VHLQLYSLRARVGITCIPLRRLIQNPGLHAQLQMSCRLSCSRTTIIDRTSRWPEAIPIAATTAVDCANALFQGWVSRFGVPAVKTSYRGAQFTSSLWAPLCSLLNIQHNQTTAYHLQSNGMVERFHRRLKDALRARCASVNWVDHLPWVLLASAQQPGKTTAPPPLRKCSAHHSFYLANF